MEKLQVAIVTVGCRANQADSAWLGRAIDPAMVDIVESACAADVHVINSCAVTAAAERDVRRAINRARRTGGEMAKILLTGCMVTACEDKLEGLGTLWHIVPSIERHRIPSLINRLAGSSMDVEDPSSARIDTIEFHDAPEPVRRSRPGLRIQDGCHHRCSYCVVPQGRGPQRSMEVEEVLERLEALADEGAREVVICGINLGEWGSDLTPRTTLADLLTILEERSPVERIRLSSIEPWAVDDAFVERLATSSRLAPHLHLPMQSGDDTLLGRMNRPYKASRFRGLVERLIEVRPELSLGTDIIAGFPGEDDDSFERTMKLVDGLPIAYLHAFGFSPRPGTPAAIMEGAVSRETIKKRVARLRSVGEVKRAAYARGLIGSVVHPLFECRKKSPEGLLRGVAGRFVVVWVEGPETLVNRIAPVVVKSVEPDGGLIGRLLDID